MRCRQSVTRMLGASSHSVGRLSLRKPFLAPRPPCLVPRSSSSVKDARRSMDTPQDGVKLAEELAEEFRLESGGRVQLDSDAWRDAGGSQPPEPAEAATVWYFAFGSNMAKEVLTGRRMVKPVESYPAVLPGYCLAFSMPGMPYREPAFAGAECVKDCGRVSNETLGPVADSHARLTRARTRLGAAAAAAGEAAAAVPDCHGVVHRITPKQWQHIKATEGAAGHSDYGYAVEDVVVSLYDGRQLQALTLVCAPKSVVFLKGRAALPSKRYLALLQAGAKEHGLAPAYQQYLAQLQPYEAATLRQRLGALLMAGLFVALVAPAFMAQQLVAKATGMSSSGSGGLGGRHMARYLHSVFFLAWKLHDLLEPVLGSGCTNCSGSGSK